MTTKPEQLMLPLGTETLYLACSVCRLPVCGQNDYICCRDKCWHIVHRACDDPAPGDDDAPWIPVFRASTAADLLCQTANLWTKDWARHQLGRVRLLSSSQLRLARPPMSDDTDPPTQTEILAAARKLRAEDEEVP
jgi:hypothetical protein